MIRWFIKKEKDRKNLLRVAIKKQKKKEGKGNKLN